MIFPYVSQFSSMFQYSRVFFGYIPPYSMSFPFMPTLPGVVILSLSVNNEGFLLTEDEEKMNQIQEHFLKHMRWEW